MFHFYRNYSTFSPVFLTLGKKVFTPFYLYKSEGKIRCALFFTGAFFLHSHIHKKDEGKVRRAFFYHWRTFPSLFPHKWERFHYPSMKRWEITRGKRFYSILHPGWLSRNLKQFFKNTSKILKKYRKIDLTSWKSYKKLLGNVFLNAFRVFNRIKLVKCLWVSKRQPAAPSLCSQRY